MYLKYKRILQIFSFVRYHKFYCVSKREVTLPHPVSMSPVIFHSIRCLPEETRVRLLMESLDPQYQLEHQQIYNVLPVEN